MYKKSILKFLNREVNKHSNHRIWKFKDFVLTVTQQLHAWKNLVETATWLITFEMLAVGDFHEFLLDEDFNI